MQNTIINVKDFVGHNAKYFNQYSEDMDLAINLNADNGPPEMVWDSIAAPIEEKMEIQLVRIL